MSAVTLPSRGQCVYDHHCHCPQFAPTLLDPVGSHSPSTIPVLMFFQYICANCVHGIHTHVDYVSMVVSHYPPTRCAAYVQKVWYCPLHPVSGAQAAYVVDPFDTALHV